MLIHSVLFAWSNVSGMLTFRSWLCWPFEKTRVWIVTVFLLCQGLGAAWDRGFFVHKPDRTVTGLLPPTASSFPRMPKRLSECSLWSKQCPRPPGWGAGSLLPWPLRRSACFVFVFRSSLITESAVIEVCGKSNGGMALRAESRQWDAPLSFCLGEFQSWVH